MGILVGRFFLFARFYLLKKLLGCLYSFPYSSFALLCKAIMLIFALFFTLNP
nr:MAG TPA: hypothetical protein [Caudoviricetes sp.]